jgi:hypothetical protein
MLPHLTNWARSETNGVLTLTPADGSLTAAIRYRERVRPLVTSSEIVALTIDAFGGATIHEQDGPHELVTEEGEYGSVTTLRGSFDGVPVATTIGVVFGDDFYSKIVSRCVEPSEFERTAAVVRDLTVRDSHALGVRRRRFRYTPPTGWIEQARASFICDWRCSQPLGTSVIRVFPANPAGDPTGLVERVLQASEDGGQLVDADGPFPLTDGAVTGDVWRLVSDRPGTPGLVHCDVAILFDGTFEYLLMLESDTELAHVRNRPAFVEVINSAQTIPRSPRSCVASDDAASAFAHWL